MAAASGPSMPPAPASANSSQLAAADRVVVDRDRGGVGGRAARRTAVAGSSVEHAELVDHRVDTGLQEDRHVLAVRCPSSIALRPSSVPLRAKVSRPASGPLKPPSNRLNPMPLFTPNGSSDSKPREPWY